MTATIVLVPGAWSGAWIWEPVGTELGRRGLAHRAVDLVTVGEDAAGRDVRDDARHVRSVVEELDGPVILVGNSYGGAVISGASAGLPSVRRLVYLAAMMPKAGEPLLEHIAGASAPEFDAGITFRDDGLLLMDGETELRTAFQQASPEMHDLVRAHFGELMSFGTDPTAAALAEVGCTTIPSTYVVCAEDRSINPEAQRRWATERATEIVEWPSDHCPQISHPDLVADLLEKLVGQI
jgi:pimeloyl-ACP methyl ester carboxylesterase